MARSRLKVLVIIALATGSSALGSTPETFSAAGIQAFKSGDFSEAKSNFEAARNQGFKSPRLHYNLGATCYRLGELEQAFAEFAAIANDPTWGGLANYNLGLISDKRGQDARASDFYRRAIERATTDKLRLLAVARLDASKVDQRQLRMRTTYVSLGTGFDDNVVLADDPTLAGVSDEADYFLDMTGIHSRDLSGAWRADIGGYYRFHRNLDDFDFGSISGAVIYKKSAARWHFEVGPASDVNVAGGEDFTLGVGFRARAYRRFGSIGVRVSNDLRGIAGSADIDYLNGFQNRFAVELRQTLQRLQWRTGLLLEINNRKDLRLENDFYSYSPARRSVFGSIATHLAERWTAEARGEIRASRYADPNVETTSDGSALVASRDAERVSAMLRLSYALASRWGLFAELHFSDSDANIPRYSYDNTRLLIGVSSRK